MAVVARLRSWLSQPRDAKSTARNMSVLLFVLFGLAYGLFTQDRVSHNTLCRAATTANLVQYGRIDINGYEELTRDKAAFGGNFYCDKAPGMSLLAVPTAFVFTRAFEVTSETPYNRVWTAFLYLCALTTSGLLTAFAGVLLFRHVLSRTDNLDAALVAAFAFGLTSLVWGWATSFFSHAATASLLVMGYIAFDEATRKGAGGPRTAFLAGLAFGAATATEYTALAAALIVGVVVSLPQLSRPRDVVVTLLWTAFGGVVALLPVLAYQAAAFGSPFETGYAHTVEFDLHRTGIVGIGLPRLDVLAELLVSPARGLLWFAPIILAMVWAGARAVRVEATRPIALATLLVLAFYLLMNAGFGYWHGGATTGPRYLTPAVGFAALALGFAWPMFGQWERRATLFLLALSILIGFACTAVSMTAGGLLDQIFPSVASGALRSTLSYLVLEQPSPLHFVAPLTAAGIMAWLIANERRLASKAAPGP